MDHSGGIQASLGGRYALALFDLAREGGQVDSVGASLSTLKAALAASADLKALTGSPLIGRKDAAKAIAAVAAALKLDPLTTRFLGVLAGNRRLFQLAAVIRAYETLVSSHKGETRADVTAAHPLDAGQVAALAAKLKARLGRDVAIDVAVDPAILGGLVVRIGSQMIDSSIRTRLNNLAMAMKG